MLATVKAPPGFPEKPRLRRWEAAAYLERVHGLQVAVATLAKYATKGGGPRYNKAGQTPLYPVDELDAWAANKLGEPVANSTEARARSSGRAEVGA